MLLDPLCLALVNDLRHLKGQASLGMEELEQQWAGLGKTDTRLEAVRRLGAILGGWRLERTRGGALILCCPAPGEQVAAAEAVRTLVPEPIVQNDMGIGDYHGPVVYLPAAFAELFRLARNGH